MNSCNSEVAVYVRMQYRGIAEANHPLWLFSELCKVKSIYNSNYTVSTPGAHDGIDGMVVEHSLQVNSSFSVCSAKSKISLTDGCAYFNA